MNSLRHYILKDKKVVSVDINDWVMSYNNFNFDRTVMKTQLKKIEISTVFLMIDHQFGEGPPLLFETMVFGGVLDEEQDRYSTWDEAVVGHNRMVERVEITEIVKLYKQIKIIGTMFAFSCFALALLNIPGSMEGNISNIVALFFCAFGAVANLFFTRISKMEYNKLKEEQLNEM